jgi:CheY-like chemotaxis protein
VEDREDNRRLLTKFLQELGLQVETAENGQEALGRWQTWLPHIIFMHMAVPDGHEVTHRIRGLSSGQPTVIVALTTTVSEEDQRPILLEGCDDFVREPCRPEDITEMLAKHLGARFTYADRAPVRFETEVPAVAIDVLATRELTAVPTVWLAALYRAAIEADAAQIRQLADEVQPLQPALATALLQWVEAFDYEAILAAIAGVETRGGSS